MDPAGIQILINIAELEQQVPSILIDRYTRGNSLIESKETTLKMQDYRHGERKIYLNGKHVHTTKKKGFLTDKELSTAISGLSL